MLLASYRVKNEVVTKSLFNEYNAITLVVKKKKKNNKCKISKRKLLKSFNDYLKKRYCFSISSLHIRQCENIWRTWKENNPWRAHNILTI